MFAFQGLHAGHFIIADDPFPLLGQGWGLVVQMIDILDLGLELRSIGRGEPIADQMGFDRGFFLKDVPRDGRKWWRRSRV